MNKFLHWSQRFGRQTTCTIAASALVHCFVHNRPLVNLMRVLPVYPAVANAKELEGHVIVQLDVGTNGQILNIMILESSNRISNNASIKAAVRFKFKPRVVDAIALMTTGIQNLFRFEMDE